MAVGIARQYRSLLIPARYSSEMVADLLPEAFGIRDHVPGQPLELRCRTHSGKCSHTCTVDGGTVLREECSSGCAHKHGRRLCGAVECRCVLAASRTGGWFPTNDERRTMVADVQRAWRRRAHGHQIDVFRACFLFHVCRFTLAEIAAYQGVTQKTVSLRCKLALLSLAADLNGAPDE